MKKCAFAVIIVCLVFSTACAQGWGNPQSTTIVGTLQLQNGTIAVVSGNDAYYVPVLTRYIGFIEGLKEGAQISIDGFVSGNFLQPSKVTIDGKVYDFALNTSRGMAFGDRGGRGCGGGGWGQFRGCW